MKINGSLVFDANSASEIQNLRLQKITSLPGITNGDVGRLVYNTNTNIIYVGTNVGAELSWVPLATGGDASALLGEVDRIESALGLNADGSFDAAQFSGNLAGQTSYVGLISALQAAVASASAAAAAEATRAGLAETALGERVDGVEAAATAETTRVDAAIAAEATRATTAEGTLTSNLAAEVARATAAEGVLDGRIDGVLADAVAESTRLEGLITAEETRATTAEGALDGRITTEETARVAGDNANATAIATETSRAITAEGVLDGRITLEVSERTIAVDAVADGLATEITDRETAITSVTTALGNEVTRATAQEALIRGELASALVGLSWEAPVDLIATDASTTDLTGLADGYRIVDLATNTIRTVIGGALAGSEVLEDGAAFFNRTNDIGYTFNGTAVVPFSGAASFVAGAGLEMTGNTVNIGNLDGSITIESDTIRVSTAVRNEITANATAVAAETTRATTAETGLGQRITDEEAARAAAVTAEADARVAADLALQTEIDAEEAARAAAITAEVAAREAGDAAAAAAVLAEENRALTAEAALGVRVDDAGTALTDAIAAEVAARDAAIAASAASDAAALAAEVAARDAAIAVEVARATAAEAAIGTRIGKMYFLYDGAPNTTHTVAHNLGQQFCNVTVVDSTNNVVIPESIEFTSANELIVTFNTAIASKVIVMGLAAVV